MLGCSLVSWIDHLVKGVSYMNGKWLLVKKDIYDYNMRDVIKWSRDLASTYYKLCMYLTEHDDYLCYKT